MTYKYNCEICGKPVEDYEPPYCCNGQECGCMGLPTEPCVCSQECYSAIMKGIGKDMDQRRIDAGIEKYQPYTVSPDLARPDMRNILIEEAKKEN